MAVNGRAAESGQQVRAGDVVTLDGRRVAWEALQAELAPAPAAAAPAPAPASSSSSGGGRAAAAAGGGGAARLPAEDRFVYITYWKPAGVVCTNDTAIRCVRLGAPLGAGSRPRPGASC